MDGQPTDTTVPNKKTKKSMVEKLVSSITDLKNKMNNTQKVVSIIQVNEEDLKELINMYNEKVNCATTEMNNKICALTHNIITNFEATQQNCFRNKEQYLSIKEKKINDADEEYNRMAMHEDIILKQKEDETNNNKTLITTQVELEYKQKIEDWKQKIKKMEEELCKIK